MNKTRQPYDKDIVLCLLSIGILTSQSQCFLIIEENSSLDHALASFSWHSSNRKAPDFKFAVLLGSSAIAFPLRNSREQMRVSRTP